MWRETLQILLDHKKYWDRVSWKDVCQHPCVDFVLLESHAPKVPMIRKYLYLHPFFQPSLVLEYVDDEQKWSRVSKTVPLQYVLPTLEDPRYHWVFRSLCENPTMTPSILKEHFWPFLSHDVRCAVLRDSFLFQHPRFPIDDLCHEPYRLVNLAGLSRHPLFSVSWFTRIPKKRWSALDWKYLSRTMDPVFIESTWPFLPWSIADLSHHRCLPFSLLVKYKKHKKWDWDAISLHVPLTHLCTYHKRLPFRYPVVSKNLHLRAWFVHEHPTKKWDRVQLAMNPAMVPKQIWEDRLLFPVWRWDHVVRNPSLDPETLQKMQRSLPQRFGLFKNHGLHDPRYIDLQAMRIHLCFRSYRRRQQFRRKLVFLCAVHTRLYEDLWDTVLMFV